MKITQEKASAAFDHFEDDPEWGGWGYLGERQRVREAVAEGEWPAEMLTRLGEFDQALATVLGTGTRAFEWANSKDGRMFADWAFSQEDSIPALDIVARYNNKWGGKLWKMGHRNSESSS